MTNSVSLLKTADGEQLHFESWMPDGEKGAEVILVHGVGEYCGRYGRLVEAFAAKGIAVHGWDQRGHGRSTGRRGHVLDWAEYRQDLKGVVEKVRSNQSRKRLVILYAHSMGALVALDAVLKGVVEVDGLIVSGVPIAPAGVTKPGKVVFARLLSRIWPTFEIQLGLTSVDMMSDEGRRVELSGDPLMHRVVTVRWGTEALKAVAEVRRDMSRLSLPLLILHGALDPVNLVTGAEALFDSASSHEKLIRVYEGTRHEPHNDVQWREVHRDLFDWIDRQCQKRAAGD